MQDRLLRAVGEVEQNLEDTGLACSPWKSRSSCTNLARERTTPAGRDKTVSKIRVLGLCWEENSATREHIARLQKKVAEVTKQNVTRPIEAHALGHIAYVAAYDVWSRSETEKLNYTATDRLLELGVHNVLEEIAEVQEPEERFSAC
ncbi:hypothetical protein HPB50_014318 [Hyalomma asiaticum]|uniref:Uncharacterized protein n=1 Tax=Hyalomma asiaticum TaxID=266040 RepID=A0ACB7RKU5_HYAAI|nr:hypothetical protein HPB50_014318 [Hyalomma asiaticum]